MVRSLCEGEAHCSEEQGMSLVNLPDPRCLDSMQEGMQYLQYTPQIPQKTGDLWHGN